MTNVKLNRADERIRKNSRIKWIMNARWGKLTRGEKAARVILKALRLALIGAAVVGIASVVIGTVLGIVVAIGIAGAITGGFENVSRANTNRLYGNYRW